MKHFLQTTEGEKIREILGIQATHSHPEPFASSVTFATTLTTDMDSKIISKKSGETKG